MKQRKLGKNGPTVSALGLGCMGMSPSYGSTNDKVSLQVLERAYDQGITFFDTADMYGVGENEKLLGQAIRSFRDKIVIATKCGIKFIGDECLIDNTPRYIKNACEESLKRLGIEQIDLYYLHRYNPEVPLKDSMGAMLDLVKEGKIKHIGLSEVGTETLEEAYALLGNKLVALQTEYSIVNRGPLEKVLPTCRKLGIGIVPYSPLGRGLLTGKIHDTKGFTESQTLDFRTILPQFFPDALPHNLRLIDALKSLTKKKNCSLSQLALAWVLAQGDDMIPIPGTKKLNYLEENLGSLKVDLSDDDLKLIDDVTHAHPIKGARYPEELMKLFHLNA